MPESRTRRRRYLRAVLIGLAVLVLAVLGVLLVARQFPRINDISTDRDDPPHYLVAPPRHPGYNAQRLRKPTERAYPDMRNLELTQPPEAVSAAVAALVAERGWSESARAPANGDRPWRIQAVAVTTVLRFRDDVIVEVRPGPGGGSTVAMRSKSRIGQSDLGANARRIRAFLADLRARLAAAQGSAPAGPGAAEESRK